MMTFLNTADIVLLIIMLIGLAIGAKRGFVKSVAGFVVLIAALVAAYFITNIISGPVTSFVQPRVVEYVASKIRLNDFDPYGIAAVNDLVKTFSGKEADLLSLITDKFVETAVRAICFSLSFLVVSIVLRLLLTLLNDVLESTPLKHLNGLLGACVGLVETVVLIYLVVYIASLLGVSQVNELAAEGGLMAFFKNTSPFALLKMIA